MATFFIFLGRTNIRSANGDARAGRSHQSDERHKARRLISRSEDRGADGPFAGLRKKVSSSGAKNND